MRIIDKNSDFYDYFQNIYYDNSLTFDRTSSFLLTKEIICNYFLKDEEYLLLQVCNTFWLFFLKTTKKNIYDRPIDYIVIPLANWKNYNKKRKLIKLDIISFSFFNKNIYDKKTINTIIQKINTNDYKIKKSFNEYTIYCGNKRIEKYIPLLKASKLAEHINPLDIYLSFEEYFSLEKTASERRDAIGTTDIDRIENHGFDKKTSFRTIR